MKQYYYFVTSLPELNLDDKKLPLSPDDFAESLMDLIDPSDISQFSLLRHHFDNINLVNLIQKKNEWNSFGVFNKETLQNELSSPGNLPQYMTHFLEKINFDEREHPQLQLLDELSIDYYHALAESPYSLIREYVKFDMNLKNLTAAHMSKKYNLSKNNTILLFDETSQSLVEGQSQDFKTIYEYEWIDSILEQLDNPSLVEREMYLIRVRLEFIREKLQGDYFSFNQIAAYYIKMFLIQRVQQWDKANGQSIFEKLSDNLSKDEFIFTDIN